jgi:hypothetical protein
VGSATSGEDVDEDILRNLVKDLEEQLPSSPRHQRGRAYDLEMEAVTARSPLESKESTRDQTSASVVKPDRSLSPVRPVLDAPQHIPNRIANMTPWGSATLNALRRRSSSSERGDTLGLSIANNPWRPGAALGRRLPARPNLPTIRGQPTAPRPVTGATTAAGLSPRSGERSEAAAEATSSFVDKVWSQCSREVERRNQASMNALRKTMASHPQVLMSPNAVTGRQGVKLQVLGGRRAGSG